VYPIAHSAGVAKALTTALHDLNEGEELIIIVAALPPVKPQAKR
jgi:hypothetical protein